MIRTEHSVINHTSPQNGMNRNPFRDIFLWGQDKSPLPRAWGGSWSSMKELPTETERETKRERDGANAAAGGRGWWLKSNRSAHAERMLPYGLLMARVLNERGFTRYCRATPG